jgi:hypothetical protein
MKDIIRKIVLVFIDVVISAFLIFGIYAYNYLIPEKGYNVHACQDTK